MSDLSDKVEQLRYEMECLENFVEILEGNKNYEDVDGKLINEIAHYDDIGRVIQGLVDRIFKEYGNEKIVINKKIDQR